ncbi:MAG: hypothetical protein ACFFDK_12500 [Promethearchaeota archaeon]
MILSFIFYPIYFLDKSISKRFIKTEKSKKSKVSKADLIGLEKEKENLVDIQPISNIQENIDKKIEFTCNFCGEKVVEDVKLCPYCGQIIKK